MSILFKTEESSTPWWCPNPPRRGLEVPDTVAEWMCGIPINDRGHVITCNHEFAFADKLWRVETSCHNIREIYISHRPLQGGPTVPLWLTAEYFIRTLNSQPTPPPTVNLEKHNDLAFETEWDVL